MNTPAAPPSGSGPSGMPRLLWALTLGGLFLSTMLAALQLYAARHGAVSPLLAELSRARLVALPLAGVLAALAGAVGTLVVAGARHRAAALAHPVTWRRKVLWPAGSPEQVRKSARWPQALLAAPMAGLGVAAALLPQGDPAAPVEQHAAWLLAGGLLVLCFPLLLAERMLAAETPARLPEAPWLRALLFLATSAFAAAGALELAAGIGVPLTARLAALLALLPAAVCAELAGRAIGRCFLPPPAAEAARGAANSILARLLAEGAAGRGLADPMRRHLGIDFAGSWALAYVRAAFAPLALLLVLIAWGLSGVALVPLDQRAAYERFGAPVRVLPPGIHLMLPWPFGRVRAVEFGPVHELALKGDIAPERFAAEAVPPATADRLWEKENPAETWFLVAAAARDRQQGFQMVSADIRLFWRVGLSDSDALRAAYGAVDPAGLLRQTAERVAAAFFAARTLDEALGENREAMAGALRATVQRNLDASGVGLELAEVVIQALHPPGGAAGAYHAVQAAQIDADASISAERGRAFATLSDQRQAATTLLTRAAAAAEETIGAERADATRFAADRAADNDGSPPFRMERRLSALQTALTAASLTVIDHRIPPGAVPLLDLRPAPGAPLSPEERLR